MLLAIALIGCGLCLQPAGIMIHSQLATQIPFSAEKSAPILPVDAGSSSDAELAENSMPSSIADSTPAITPAAPPADAAAEQPVGISKLAELPSAPVMSTAVNSPAPMAFLKRANSMTISVAELREEDRRKRRLWIGLAIAEHSAATFDAWSTRQAITTSGAQELNPLLKPFAGNASLYLAIQVAPALMDFAGRKMMYSRYSWVRRVWWVPQSASFVSSIFCGAHNLSVH